MCFVIFMKVIVIKGFNVMCEVKGVFCEVSLYLV